MICSQCGQLLDPEQALCPRCGRWATPAAQVSPETPPAAGLAPGFDLLVRNYAGKVKVLAVLWFVYAALSVLTGFAGIAFLQRFVSGGFGSLGSSLPAAAPPSWILPAIVRFAWMMIAIRVVLAAIAGWGLLQRAQWGRIIAIVAAIFALFRFPLGTALGIATLVILLGSRNATLYEQI